MITAQFRIVPVGSGSSMKEEVAKALGALDRQGVHYEVGPLATSIEAESIDQVFQAIKAAHDALAAHVPRLAIDISIDHRIDKEETLSTLTKGLHAEDALVGPFA